MSDLDPEGSRDKTKKSHDTTQNVFSLFFMISFYGYFTFFWTKNSFE